MRTPARRRRSSSASTKRAPCSSDAPTGFTSVPGSGIPQRLYHFEVDQEVKGDLGRAVSVRIPVKPVNGGQVIPRDIAAGVLMSRADGSGSRRAAVSPIRGRCSRKSTSRAAMRSSS